MNVIYKYQLFTGLTAIGPLPAESKVVKVAGQNGEITMWIEHAVDTTLFENRSFLVYATGEPFNPEPFNPEGKAHVGTTLVGDYVWHVFEVTK